MRDQATETLKIEQEMAAQDYWLDLWPTDPGRRAWWNEDHTYRRYNPCGGGRMNKVNAAAAERTMKAES